MRLSAVLVALLSFFTLALAWTKEDYEIFDLVGDIEATEGKGTTFYSWLEIGPKATIPEITKAYKKKSVQLHPDKNPNGKGVQERFARLGKVAAILRDPEGRTRYDFFYKNGVPKWRGTGYYYSRYRPGLGFVFVFLAILSSALQYIVMKVNYQKDLARIEKFVTKARQAAWGPKMIPNSTPKKVKVAVGSGPEDDSRAIEMLVEGPHVYILGGDEPVLLDSEVAAKPAISRTWLIALVKSLVSQVLPAKAPKEKVDAPEGTSPDVVENNGSAEEDTDAADATDEGASTPSGRRPAAASKAGGRRRKNAPPKKR